MKDLRVLIGVIGILFISSYMLVSNKQGFTYDEPYYISNVDVIKTMGLGKGFLTHIEGPAGPLYGYIHYFISPITNTQVKSTRIVNIIFGILILFILYKLLFAINPENKNTAFLLLSIPMAFPTMGMALTEIPAMVFFSIALLLLLVVYKKDNILNKDMLLLALAGLCFSTAILGRQPYLLCLGTLIIIVFYDYPMRKKATAAIFIAAALILPLYIFSLWGGLVPNNKGGDVVAKSFLSPINMVLAFGYSAMIMFILSPSFFLKINSKIAITYLLLFLTGIPIFFYSDLSFTPMMSVSQKILPAFLSEYYGYVMCSLICTVAIFFVHTLLARMKENNKNFNYVLVSCMLLVLIFSCIKITHQFSSRYVFQAAPLFLIIASFHYKNDNYTRVLNVIGMIIGMISLINYY